MAERSEILGLILATAGEFNDELEVRIAVEEGEAAHLFGAEGVLDSLALVSFLTALEQNIEDRLDISLTLADEKAMSRHRSPFKTVGSLLSYVLALMEEAGG